MNINKFIRRKLNRTIESVRIYFTRLRDKSDFCIFVRKITI